MRRICTVSLTRRLKSGTNGRNLFDFERRRSSGFSSGLCKSIEDVRATAQLFSPSYVERADAKVVERTDFADDFLLSRFQFGVAVDDQDEIIDRFAELVDVGDFAGFRFFLVEFVLFVQIDVQQVTEDVTGDVFVFERLDACVKKRVRVRVRG